jgi:hypothetical protein
MGAVEMDDDKPECDICGCQVPLEEYEDGMPRRTWNLCELCASTAIVSKLHQAPTQGDVVRTIHRAVRWLLKELLEPKTS